MRVRPPVSGPARLVAVAAAFTVPAALAATGLSAAPAQSAVDRECPTAASVADLKPGDPVDGSTVSQGTATEPFRGTVQGVLDNGIAPGLDLVMVRLTSPEIDRVGGIWQGMSGSPVYNADNQLIGAVAYGLSLGPSTLAGVTPAAEMQKMLTVAPSLTAAPRTTVRIPPAVSARLAGTGVATAAQLNAGMAQLRMPVGLSGLTSSRFREVGPVLRIPDVQGMAAGSGATSGQPIGIVAGGNLAASLSHGVITAAGVGTATMVCGNEVIGFGHPMSFTGRSTMALHGASAIGVQEDPTLAAFKLANLGAPIGTVTEDHLAGIKGVTGPTPPTADITSSARIGTRVESGTTHVSVPEVFTDVAFSHLIALQDRALDRLGKGAGTASWTIRGVRRSGAPFTLAYSDMFADAGDISPAPAIAIADQLSALIDNGTEDVRIASVTASTRLDRPYETYSIRTVEIRANGRWVPVRETRTLRLKAGTTKRLRVTLVSRQVATRRAFVSVRVPRGAVGRFGSLEVVGGNSSAFSDQEFFDTGFGEFGSTGTRTVPQVLRQLASAPRHNQVVATLTFRGARGAAAGPHTGKVSLNRVVDGGVFASVRAR